MWWRIGIFLVGMSLALPVHAADEDSDLNRIPTETPAAPATTPAAPSKDVNYIGEAFGLFWEGEGLVGPFPAPGTPSWENLLVLDTRDE